MESVNEVIIVADNGPKDLNCSMYDLSTLSLIESYKEGHSGRHGLDFIGNDYIISAFDDKPKMKIWQFGQNESRKITTPGIVSALAVSSCGRYCIAGIGKRTYIWEVATGNLEAHMEYHVQDVTCIKFSSDSSHFITGGKDSMVFVFLLTDIIVEQESAVDIPKAHFTWTGHSAEVTDIHVGSMSFYSRVATASKDMTCRLYELDTGYHLCTIRMEVPLTSITMDICEYFLFLGSKDGNIYKINLFEKSNAEMHFENVEKKNVFVGHRREITSLCVSYTGKYLISGSTDKDFRIWDIANFTCIHEQTQPGPISNIITCLLPPGIRSCKYIPRLITGNFRRVLNDNNDEDLPTNITSQELSLFHAGAPDQFFDSKVMNLSMKDLQKMLIRSNVSVDDLSQINNELYAFALGHVVDMSDTGSEDAEFSN